MFLAKVSSTAAPIWIHSYGGAMDEKSESIVVDPNGQSYSAGEFAGTAIFGTKSLTSAGMNDLYLLSVAP